MLNNNTRDTLYRRFFSHSSHEEGGDVSDGMDSDSMDSDSMDSDSMDSDSMAAAGMDSEGKHIERKDVIFHGENKLDRTQGFHFSSPKKVCIYSIKIVNNNPFLTFLLYKKKHHLTWTSTTEFAGKSVDIIMSSIKKKQLFKHVVYKGEINNILWFENINDTVETALQKKEDRFITCLVGEIINIKKYLNIPIGKEVTEFFLHNREFIYLYNSSNLLFDTPTIGYHGNYYNKILLAVAVGLKREVPQSSLGSFYYFGNYEQAIRFAIWTKTRKPMMINNKEITINEKGKYTRGGLGRFVLFLGESTAIITGGEDIRIKEDFYINNKWTKLYDSVILGIKYLSSHKHEGKIKLQPQIVIKSFEQQAPLTYYFVDTSQKTDIDNLHTVDVE